MKALNRHASLPPPRAAAELSCAVVPRLVSEQTRLARCTEASRRPLRETAARLGESTQLLNIPFSPVYKALSIGVGLYAAVLVIEAVVLAVKREVPVLLDESRAMGNPQ